MLTRLNLQNIKLHKNLTINFHPNINVFVGASDSGKTGFLKGLLWNLTNASTGEKLIHNGGAKECVTTLEFDGGHAVTRKWAKSLNAYELDGTPFCSFRSDVPAPIADLLRIDTVNIQRRRDLPFMVYWKASDSAEQFSQMMDISEINESISACNKMVSEAQQNVVTVEKQLEAKIIEAKNYTDVDPAFAELNELLKTATSVTELEETIKSQSELLECYNTEHLASIRLANSVEALAKIKTLEDSLQQIEQLSTTIAQYTDIVALEAHYRENLNKYAEAPQALQDLEALSSSLAEVTRHVEDVAEFETLLAHYVEVRSKCTALSNVPDAIIELEKLERTYSAISEAEAELKQVVSVHLTYGMLYKATERCKETLNASEELWRQEMPDECPLCGLSKKECKDA